MTWNDEPPVEMPYCNLTEGIICLATLPQARRIEANVTTAILSAISEAFGTLQVGGEGTNDLLLTGKMRVPEGVAE